MCFDIAGCRITFLSMELTALVSLRFKRDIQESVMFRHYLNIVSKADAERYWNIRP